VAQRALRTPPVASSWMTVVGVALAAVLVLAVLLVAAAGGPDASGALLVGPILFLVSLPVFSRRARLEGDRRLFWLLVLALLAKFIGSVVRYYVAFDVYGGVADAAGYHDAGVRIAERFGAGNFETGLDSLSDTNFIRFLTGVVYSFTGPTGLGGFFVFSWLGFWGLYFFYRAFRVAVPEGRSWGYAKLVFFVPTLVFWPSSIGKEAWMTFALGIAAIGAARILSGRTWRGLVVAGIGLWAAAIVRPHVAGLLAVGLAAGYLFRRPRRELRVLAPVSKAFGLAALVVVAFLLVGQTDDFLRRAAFQTEGGVTAVLRQTTERTDVGGSKFAPSILESPARAPVAVITVLYRPFLFEVHNVQALAASLETTFLLVLSVVRWQWILSAIRSIRRQPYVAMALMYTGIFIVAFSGFANFGLLARERAQLLPLALVLLCVPPRERDDLDEVRPTSRGAAHGGS
jgi:hypothetical protein